MKLDEERTAKLDAVDRCKKAVGSVLCLSTGTLVLPIIFLRDMVGMTKDKVIGGFLNGIVSSWICLMLAIACCLFYFYFAAKLVKSIHNLRLSSFWGDHAEVFCQWTFVLSLVFFGFGVIYYVLFAYLIYFRF